MGLSDTAPTSIIVRLYARPDEGEMCACARPAASSTALSVDGAVLVVNLWHEGPDVVRGSITHPGSGCVAMVHGNGALRRLAHALHLRIVE